MRNTLIAGALAVAALAAHGADAVVTPGDIEHVGLYGGPAIVVHRTLTTHANENSGGWHYHPGYVYNVVKSGTIAVQDGCDAQPRLYRAGQAFETSEGRVHRAFVPREPGKDTGREDAVEENMFILPAGDRNAEGKPILGRNVPDTMGHSAVRRARSKNAKAAAGRSSISRANSPDRPTARHRSAPDRASPCRFRRIR